MTVVAVSDRQEMQNLMKETIKWPNPIYIRLGTGGGKIISKKKKKNLFLAKLFLIKKEVNIFLFLLA